ncbi:MAG: 3'-5' exoribonuclease [Bacteroidales bacterium]|nr:3'-5' exoribonuclease [Bacteroidales bacterium]
MSMDTKNHLGHIMIDIETATDESASILSIAAVEFCLKTGKTGRIFYERVNSQTSLYKVLYDFRVFLGAFNQGAMHNLPEICASRIGYYSLILQNAYRSVFTPFPWVLLQECNIQTLNFAIKETPLSKKKPYNALNNCQMQIQHCSQIYQPDEILSSYL